MAEEALSRGCGNLWMADLPWMQWKGMDSCSRTRLQEGRCRKVEPKLTPNLVKVIRMDGEIETILASEQVAHVTTKREKIPEVNGILVFRTYGSVIDLPELRDSRFT
jgi:hypothetical protein